MEMYRSLAAWWSILTPQGTYDMEACFFWELLAQPRSVLELGAGIGALAASFPADAHFTLVDRSPEMLAQSMLRNPAAEHICESIETLALSKEFDSVLIHDAIMYMTTPSQLRHCFQVAWNHLRKGGRLLVVPDCVRETFVERAMSGGAEKDGQAVQLLEWHWAPAAQETYYNVEFSFLFRECGRVSSHHETHRHGLFSILEYKETLEAVGFQIVEVDPEGRYFLAERAG